ncbi:tetratricopeptide repeat protein [Deinococcus malanensis]|uniref:tetratricopeptide repeat protein n=1 Tax=Deinococcus malanensis TaxID=1706855 RepID=UPI0036368F47
MSRALAFWRTSGNTHGVAYALYSLGRALLDIGDTGQAQHLLRESLDLRRAIGDERGIIASQTALGLSAVMGGEFRKRCRFCLTH